VILILFIFILSNFMLGKSPPQITSRFKTKQLRSKSQQKLQVKPH